MQTLYAAMHEPDGVRGVNALRREEPSLREQILEHESIGLLRDATACYDRAIQLESDQVHTHTFFLFFENTPIPHFRNQSFVIKNHYCFTCEACQH